jgi:hypothetical protein
MLKNIEESDRDWTSEFKVDDRGQVYGSRKGAARLCGVTKQAIQQLLKAVKEGGASKTLSQPLQPFAGQDFEGGNQIPDLVISAIVAHYAFLGYELAQKTLLAMNAIGTRAYLQQKLGWKPPQIELPAGANPLQVLELTARQMESSGCNPSIVAQWKIDQYASLYPAIGDGLRQAKAIVSASTDYPALPVSPTRLGQLITQRKKLDKAVSAEQVNKALANLGFQERGADRLWKLTEAGQEYGHLQQVVVNGTPRPQLRWDVEILNQLYQLFSATGAG